MYVIQLPLISHNPVVIVALPYFLVKRYQLVALHAPDIEIGGFSLECLNKIFYIGRLSIMVKEKKMNVIRHYDHNWVCDNLYFFRHIYVCIFYHSSGCVENHFAILNIAE